MSKIKIAKEGGSIQDAVKDLVFDSDEDYLLILEERIDTSDASKDLTISHGLGYLPAYYTFLEGSGGKWYRQTQSVLGGSYSDTNNIYLKTDNASQRVKTIIWANSQDNSVGSSRNNAEGKLKIAKSGYDVDTASDLRQLDFTSSKGVLKIKEKVSLDVNITSSSGTFTNTYSHGLGYVPQAFVFLNGEQIPQFNFIAAGQALIFDFTIDNQDLIVTASGNGFSPQTVTFQAHIFMDKIA